jgi:Protein of unknown function with PCYCGC motif
MIKPQRAISILLALIFFGVPLSATGWRASGDDPVQSAPASSIAIPLYHDHAPTGPLLKALPWKDFIDNPAAANAYYYGEHIRATLYQLPCFCHCDKSLGHTCLLDCITKPDKHAAICQLCLKEILYAYKQVKAGKSAPEIRKEIIAGKYDSIDLTKYHTLPHARPKNYEVVISMFVRRSFAGRVRYRHSPVIPPPA